MNSEETLKLFDRYVIPNYNRYPVTLTQGEGSFVLGQRRQSLSRFFQRLGL